MIPSIGRIVWVNALLKSDQFCAAIVTYVHYKECVNLAVFDRNGDLQPMNLIPFYHGDDGKIPLGQCGWMPYQVQAERKSKAEEFEAQAVQLKERVSFLETQVQALTKALAILTPTRQVPPPAAPPT